ncbi:MAG: tryptophan--tRNA ligase [bacterium]|nr:tryptophan--tRNA ligase [bacterium]
MKPTLVSGIQPTGQLHIGNYLGALQNLVALQNSGKYECYFFIADLHSLTTASDPYSAKEKQSQLYDLAAHFFAAGLDPKKSVIFLQSQVPAHTELAWLLGTVAPIGALSLMTQFKDKVLRPLAAPTENSAKKIDSSEEAVGDIRARANAGLFTYPVLMAADILIYDAAFAPVGEDQTQHLELARELVRKWNARFGQTFIEPQALYTEHKRVMSLDDPSKKMSKSQPKGCLFLDDTSDAIRDKIKRAVTDSGTEIVYDPAQKPAISNLLDIYAALSSETPEEAEIEFKGKNYGEFKTALAERVTSAFADYRKKKADLMAKPAALKRLLASGAKKANARANKKLEEVKKKVGVAL